MFALLHGVDFTRLLGRHGYRFDHYKLAHRAFVDELDASRNLGKKRVILAAPHVQPRLHPRAALPHDNRSSRNQLPSESLEAKPLRVRVAPVS